jgi:hypothetical protein
MDDALELRPHHGAAVLVFGILSLVFVVPLGVILGPVAWFGGGVDLREMDAGRMDPSGRGLTLAGKVCGMIGTLVLVVPALVALLLFGTYLLTGRVSWS